MTLLAACLLLLQAQDKDPGIVAVQLDGVVKGISGYNSAKALPPVGDEAFLRRIMKDLVDAAPAADELQAFVADPDPKKRPRKIDQLLADDRFAAFWAKRLRQVLIPDVEQFPWRELSGLTTGRQGRAVEKFTAWLAARIKVDKPWTETVHQMIDARGTLDSDPALAWMASMRRGKGLPLEFAERLSRDILGVRIGCARCHDHPYEKWTVDDYYGLAAFVVRQHARVGGDDLEVKYAAEGELKLDSANLTTAFGPREGTVIAPKFLFGGAADKNDDRMKSLAGFVTQRSTTQLPRALANRIWSWLFDAGIVQPVDDFTLKNKPLSPTLLDALVRLLQENNYSVKHLVRVVCNTKAYQMPTPEEAPEGESFRHLAARLYVPRLYTPLPSQPAVLPLKMELPAPWTRVKELNKAKGLFLIPNKEDKSRSAELWLFSGLLDKNQWPAQTGLIDPRKTTVMALEGKGKLRITLTELAGQNWCQLKSEGPVDYRYWMAEVEAAKPLHFRVGAPADLLDPWRADFVAFLQSLQ